MNGQGRFGVRQYVPTSTNPLWNNLIHYYSGDSTANDLKGTAHATLVNGTTYATGLINNGFNFDGLNDYVSTPPLNYTSGDITISFYMNPTYNNNIQGYIESKNYYTNGYTNQFSINYYQGGNSMRFVGTDNLTLGSFFDFDTWDYTTWTTKIKTNQYHHVVLQYIESTRTIKLYFNRELKFTNTLPVGKTLNIADGLVFNSKQMPFAGKMDEIAIWNRAITYKEITELYNGGTPYSSFTLSGKQYSVTENYVAPSAEPAAVAVTTGLVMNLDAGNFDSYPGIGTTWTDLTGNGNNGTLVNGTSYNSTNGGTLVFDGVNDYVSLTNNNLPMGTSDFTWSTWFKTPNSFSSWQMLLSTSQYYAYFGSLNGVLRLDFGGPAGVSALSPNTWYNMVITRVSGTNGIKAYANGSFVGNLNLPINFNLTGNMNIGNWAYNNSLSWLGNISSVQIYNRALSSTEVTANFDVLKTRYGL